MTSPVDTLFPLLTSLLLVMGSAEPPGDDVAGSLSSYKKFEKSLASKSSKKMVILIREITKTEEEDKKDFFVKSHKMEK